MSDSTPGGEAAVPDAGGAWTAPGQTPARDAGWTQPPPAPPAPPAPGRAAVAPTPASTPPPGLLYAPTAPPVAAPPTYRSWQPGIIPLRPLSFGDFLATPFKAMRFNRAVVLGGPLLFTLVAGILSVTATWLVFTDSQLGIMDYEPSLSGINGQTVAMIVVAFVAMLLADVMSSSIVAPGVARAILGERISLGLAWRQMRRRLGSLLLLYVVSAAVYALLLSIAFIPIIVGIGTGDSLVGWVLLTVLIGLLLLMPTGVLVTLFQGIARSMVVLEGISAIAALRRTFALIKGRFWWTVLIVVVTAVLIYIVSYVLQYAGQLVSLVGVFAAPENDLVMGIAFILGYGLTFLVSMVATYSYMGAVFALVYTDLRMRHEGFDLDLAQAAEARAARAGR